MNVPTISKLSRLTKVHKYSAAGVAAAGVGVMAITGVSGTAGTAVASQRVADWTPATNVQQQSIAGQAVSAAKQAVADAAVAKQKAAAKAAKAAKAAAAKTAAARKQAAAQAAQRKRAAAASRSQQRTAIKKSVTRAVTSGTPQQVAASMMSASSFQCFSNIVTRESGWNYTATNASSGAYGLVQALPGSKMASAGSDWRTNPATQIKWGLSYMNGRYGSPCGAWSFWQAHNWY